MEQTTETATGKPQVTFADFQKLDFRVAKVTSAEIHPNADRLLVLKLDDGTPQVRQVCAGIRQFYEPEMLIGKLVVIVANLEPRKIRGEISEGMVLAATETAEDGVEKDVVVLTLDRPLIPGSTVS